MYININTVKENLAVSVVSKAGGLGGNAEKADSALNLCNVQTSTESEDTR
jgi:hypothetical protein